MSSTQGWIISWAKPATAPGSQPLRVLQVHHGAVSVWSFKVLTFKIVMKLKPPSFIPFVRQINYKTNCRSNKCRKKYSCRHVCSVSISLDQTYTTVCTEIYARCSEELVSVCRWKRQHMKPKSKPAQTRLFAGIYRGGV